MKSPLSERERRSVKVNRELLKYLPRPVGGLQGNQLCYSGKLADTQNHLELIMACSCTPAGGVCTSTHTHTHLITCAFQHVGTHKGIVCAVHTVDMPPTCSHTSAHMFVGQR